MFSTQNFFTKNFFLLIRPLGQWTAPLVYSPNTTSSILRKAARKKFLEKNPEVIHRKKSLLGVEKIGVAIVAPGEAHGFVIPRLSCVCGKILIWFSHETTTSKRRGHLPENVALSRVGWKKIVQKPFDKDDGPSTFSKRVTVCSCKNIGHSLMRGGQCLGQCERFQQQQQRW